MPWPNRPWREEAGGSHGFSLPRPADRRRAVGEATWYCCESSKTYYP